jgi:hypothetical protein
MDDEAQVVIGFDSQEIKNKRFVCKFKFFELTL